MKMKITLLICIFVFLQTCFGEEITLRFEDDCEYDIYKPNEDKSYIVLFEGRYPGSYCKYSFIGRSDDALDEYKTCVETEQYDVTDSGVKLKYFTGFSSYPDRTYTMYDSSPPTFCSDSDEYLDLQLDTNYFTGTIDSRIKLKVYAVKTYDYGAVVGAIVGGVLGGIAVLSIIVTICIVVACRRKRTSGTVRRPPPSTATTTSYPLVQTSTGQFQQAYPPPQPTAVQQQGYGQQQAYPYPVQQYSAPQQAYPIQQQAYPTQPQPQYNAPPPQYPGYSTPDASAPTDATKQ